MSLYTHLPTNLNARPVALNDRPLLDEQTLLLQRKSLRSTDSRSAIDRNRHLAGPQSADVPTILVADDSRFGAARPGTTAPQWFECYPTTAERIEFDRSAGCGYYRYDKHFETAVAAGCDDYLLKPIDFDRLDAILDYYARHCALLQPRNIHSLTFEGRL